MESRAFGTPSTFTIAAGLVCLGVLSFFARSVYTMTPELDDPLIAWGIVKQLTDTGELPLLLAAEHHSARWAVTLPSVLYTNLFGTSLTSYFAVPLLFFGLTFAVFMGFAYREIDTKLLPAFAVFLFFEPMFFLASTQLKQYVFGVFYLAMSLWFVVRHIDKGKSMDLGLAAFFAFLAYGAKVTFLFYVLGLVILLACRLGSKSVTWFCTLLLVFLGVETLAFNSLSGGDLTFGRIEFLLFGPHLAGTDQGKLTVDLVEFIVVRWRELPWFNQLICLISGAYFLYIILARRFRDTSTTVLGMLLMSLSYAFLITVLPVQGLRSRYLLTLMPFITLICFAALDDVVQRAGAAAGKLIIIGTNAAALVVLILSVAGHPPFTFRDRSSLGYTVFPQDTAMIWNHGELRKSIIDGYGICARKTRPLVSVKKVIESYLDDDGEIGELIISNEGDYRFLHKSSYTPEQLTGYYFHKRLTESVEKEQCIGS